MQSGAALKDKDGSSMPSVSVWDTKFHMIPQLKPPQHGQKSLQMINFKEIQLVKGKVN